jgi:hypothetical protein
MLLLGVSITSAIAIGAAVEVAFTMGAALTLLPAVLSLLGPRVNSLHVPGRHPAGTTTVSARDGEPAVHRRRPRRGRRRVPVRLDRAGGRPGQFRSAHDDVRDRVRAVHRLPGIPAQPHPGGVARPPRQRPRRARRHEQGQRHHHRRRDHHDRCLRAPSCSAGCSSFRSSAWDSPSPSRWTRS